MSETLKAGDVVKLKSGGPAMTIRWCKDSDAGYTAWCDWFEGTEQRGHRFSSQQLVKVDHSLK